MPSFAERHRDESWDDITQGADEATKISYSPILAVVVVEVGFIAHLVVSFPFFFLVASCPIVLAKKQVLVHQGFWYIK